MEEFNIGDRVVVCESLYGIFDGKKGDVVCVIDDTSVMVILDMNRGKIGEKTVFTKKQLKKDILIQEEKRESIETKIVNSESSIDYRIDMLEDKLKKHDLSVKEGCGFMYIYDFLEVLSNNFDNFSEEDKKDIIFCLVGKK